MDMEENQAPTTEPTIVDLAEQFLSAFTGATTADQPENEVLANFACG